MILIWFFIVFFSDRETGAGREESHLAAVHQSSAQHSMEDRGEYQ